MAVEKFLVCLVLHLASSQDDSSDPVVNTLTGMLSGLKEETPAGNQFYKFLGISYAEAPTDSLRFKDPVLKQAWSGILNATEFPPGCIQRSYTDPVTLIGS
jgi:carboxylesterase type B